MLDFYFGELRGPNFTPRESAFFELLKAGFSYWTEPLRVNGVNAFESCSLQDGKPCLPCSKTIDLDQLIAKTTLELTGLLNQHRKLRQDINTVHEPIIHRLPIEVSAMIFKLALSDPRSHDYRHSSSLKQVPITTPFTLGAVCRTWRNLTWHSPYLWTRISLNIDSMLYNKTYSDNARSWLQKARKLPLAIHIHTRRSDYDNGYCCYCERDTDVVARPNKLVRFIEGHIPRCQELSIDCTSCCFLSLRGDAPILDKLEVVSDFDLDDLPETRLIHLTGMKHDIQISLDQVNVASVTVDWSKVVYFDGLNISSNNCDDLFARASNLTSCRFTWTESRFYSELPPFAFANESLRSLVLVAKNDLLNDMLSLPELPALTHLGLDARRSPLPQVVAPFLQRISGTLTSLTLCHVVKDISTIFFAAPMIRELEIVSDKGRDFHPKTAFLLLGETSVVDDHDESNPRILPNLQLLTIRFNDVVGFPWKHVPTIFGPADNIKHPKRRPLNTLRIIHNWDRTRSDCPVTKQVDEQMDSPSLNQIQKDVIRRLLRIADAGVVLDLRDVRYKLDLFKASLEHHSIQVPAWYNSNANMLAADIIASSLSPGKISSHAGRMHDLEQ